MINNRQVKAARALLDWSQEQLEQVSTVGRKTIYDFEKGSSKATDTTIGKLQKTLESHGIEFTSGSGVRLKDQTVSVLEDREGEQFLLDDIFKTLQATGGEVLIYGVHGESPLAYKGFREMVVKHVERLYAAGLTQRVLKKEGDTNFIAPRDSYRWIEIDETIPAPLYIYDDKVAFSQLTEPKKTIIIENSLIAQSARHLFNFAWDNAKSVPPEKKKKTA